MGIGMFVVVIIMALVAVLLGMVSPAYAQSINFTKLVEDRYTHEYSPDPSVAERGVELGYGEFVTGEKYNLTDVFVQYESPTSLILWGDANHTKALWEVVDIAKQNGFSIDVSDVFVIDPIEVFDSTIQYHVVMSKK